MVFENEHNGVTNYFWNFILLLSNQIIGLENYILQVAAVFLNFKRMEWAETGP